VFGSLTGVQATIAWLRGGVLACVVLVLTPASAGAYLSLVNISPFPRSKAVVGARWTSQRHDPPSNQWGDILATLWAHDDETYVMMDDGGTDVPVAGGLWRQSVARISGTPPRLRFSNVSNPNAPPPHTWSEIHANPRVWQGPLGPYYSSGLVEVDHTFYATQESDWNWSGNGRFAGLAGIAYSRDSGRHWRYGGKRFPAPLGNLSWVASGRGGSYSDGYVYAHATEREFNASRLVIGRAKPGVANITDPAHWQWISGWTKVGGLSLPVWSSSLKAAIAVISWPSHITYPQITYDAPLGRYLLTFTYSYASTPPAVWRNGAELVVLEAPQPWGPFSFVAHEPEFGPSNGYDPGFPPKWISANGRDLWLKWAANWAGCANWLNCSGAYGFNYRRMHLTAAGDH
jgi:hypothetical protein